MNTTNFFCNLFINFFSFQKLKIENVKKKKIAEMYDFYIFLRKIDLTTRYRYIILYIDIFGEKMIWEK